MLASLSAGVGLLRRAAQPLLLPGEPEEDLGFLRLAASLSALALSVYDCAPEQLGSTTHLHLPLPAAAGVTAPPGQLACMAAQLAHLRVPSPAEPPAADAAHSSNDSGGGAGSHAAVGHGPQQFAVFQVEGLGLVVAFRGTAALDDCTLNTAIRPQALPADPQLLQRGVALHLHSGFLQGVLPHAEAIAAVVRRCLAAQPAGQRQRLWLTGHSLGGAYATALALLLLANSSLHDLLAQGGGVVTFGAPMVVHAADPAALYAQLATLADWAAEGAGQGFCFHNIVNGMDMVPRLLGGAMGRVHDVLQAWLPSLAAVRGVSELYRPVGQYHLLLGGALRTLPQQPQQRSREGEEEGRHHQGQPPWGQLGPGPPPAPACPPAQAAPATAAAATAAVSCRGGLGSEAYARQVAAQLEISGVWRAALLAAGEAGLYRDHGMLLYKTQLCACLEAAAAAQQAAAAAAAAAAAQGGSAAPAGGAAEGWAGNRRSPSLEHKASLFQQENGGSSSGGQGRGPGRGSEAAPMAGGGGQLAAAGSGGSDRGSGEAVLQTTDRVLEVVNSWLASWAQQLGG